MQVRNILLRILKILGKGILGLLLVLLLAVALIHLPPVQKEITYKVSNYLTSKIGTKVDIHRIRFSILGTVAIEDATIRDPTDSIIFSAHKIEVSSSIYNLISGNYIFDQVHIEGADCNLIQHEEGLNIQFILDAFQPTEKRTTTHSSPVVLGFKNVQLKNIEFEFTSMVSGTSVAIDLRTLSIQGAEFSTKPITIKADQVYLQQSVVDILSIQNQDIQKNSVVPTHNLLLSPDFDTGIVFDIKNLQLKDDRFSFHRDQVTDTQKFDPAHLSLNNIQLNLADFLMRDDTLAAGVQSLSAKLPGFTLTDVRSAIQLNHEQLILSDLHLASGNNEVNANLAVPNDLKSEKVARAKILCLINPSELAYFLNDTLLNYFRHWGPAEFKVEGNYALGKAKIETLNLKTRNSELLATGMIDDLLDVEKISWKDVVATASIGSDFKRTLNPFFRTINIPPVTALQLNSSGNLKKIFAEGKVFTNWGNLNAIGEISLQAKKVGVDITLAGEKVNLGKWMNVSSLGIINISASAKGVIGNEQNIKINGLIHDVEFLNQPIHFIDFESSIRKDSASIFVSIDDPNYRTESHSEISFAESLILSNKIQLDGFKLGRLLHADSSLTISGTTRSEIRIDKTSMEGYVQGEHISFHKQEIEYSMDTMIIHALLSPAKSDFEYYTDYAKINLTSNFDIRGASEIFQNWSENILKTSDTLIHNVRPRTAYITLELKNESFLKLLGVEVDNFSSLTVNGEFDEQKQTASLHATSGEFKGYGVSLDTLHANLTALRDTLSVTINAKNLLYDSIHLGNLDFDVVTKGDTAASNLWLSTDSITLLGLSAHLIPVDSGLLVHPDKLITLNKENLIDKTGPVFIGKNNVAFDHLRISRNGTEIKLNGDLNYFDVSLKNIDLTAFNFLLSPDTTIISNGNLTGIVSYSRDHQLNLRANIDSLSVYNSNPLVIRASAMSDGNEVPFELQVTNASDKIDLKGKYETVSKDVNASLLIDINDLELFQFLVAEVVDEMNGAIKGKATITGPIQKPSLKGSLRFMDMELTTVNPKLTFNVKDDSIVLDNSSLIFNRFTLYDKKHHPLTITGKLTSKDYQSLTYDLQINSDEYTLINNPDSTSGKVRGLLVLDSDIKLKGDGKDTNIVAALKIKDATNLTFVSSNDDIKMLKVEGIVDFIDPATARDSVALQQSVNLYDSLIASLPDFNLNATLAIEENAVLRLLIDEQSGDYIEASGLANLELGYDRTGTLQLSGNYTVRKGVYRLSFYDLVKKNFNLVQGSSINWSGSPKAGDLNIKAVHTVESNSLGLIGHEIGENEKSIYKRSLDYAVGIDINGTIEKPVISFALDLPKNEKVNYPVLANKLDRLRLPEYESELNKQVFGLLVLGGFLPESSSDVNSTVIATTALSNSVNSLLASQLNRFTSQYIKGVNIDVGIQSFSDYSTPGGKTQTAMDFRVSKRIMNDRLSFEIGGDFDINQDQSGANTGTKNYRGDIAIIYDLTGNGDRQLKLFNNETYDIIYQEVQNTGISLIFIREFDSKGKKTKK